MLVSRSFNEGYVVGLLHNHRLVAFLIQKVPSGETLCVFADAFADAETDDNNSKDYVHIRIQQRNGKKSLTTVQVIYAVFLLMQTFAVNNCLRLFPFSPVSMCLSSAVSSHSLQGLEKGIDYKKVLKAFKKDFCCNGTVVEDSELGQVHCCYHLFVSGAVMW